MNMSNEEISETDTKGKTLETHSCCNVYGHSNHDASIINSDIVYRCPMKCEGDKTYKAPGICPDCNMHLKLVT